MQKTFAALLLVLAVAACSGGGQIPAPSNAVAPAAVAVDSLAAASVAQDDTFAATSPCGTARIYVADYAKNDIEIYKQGVANPSPCGKISTGIDAPEGIYVDGKGTLYVANFLSSQITEYAHGKHTPTLTITTATPAYDVFVGKGGVVYAAEPDVDAVAEYAANTITPLRTLSINGGVYGVATDRKNNLYVSYLSNADSLSHVEKFAPNATTGTTLALSLPFSGEVKIDSANDVILGNRNNNDTLNVFPPGATVPSRTFSTAGNPVNFALNKTESTIYVSGLGLVQALDYATGAGITNISTGLTSPSGVALFPPAPY